MTKNMAWMLAAGLLATGLSPAEADTAEKRERPERIERRHGQRGGGETGPGKPGGPPPFEHWMERVRRRDPAEYERLNRLREEDPEALREILRTRVREQWLHKRLREHPRLYEALMDVPPGERERLFRPFAEGKARDGTHFLADPDPEGKETEIRRRLRLYHEAPDDEREAARSALREALAEGFDARAAHWRRAAEQAERQLELIRRKLAEQENRREELIDRRMEALTAPRPSP